MRVKSPGDLLVAGCLAPSLRLPRRAEPATSPAIADALKTQQSERVLQSKSCSHIAYSSQPCNIDGSLACPGGASGFATIEALTLHSLASVQLSHCVLEGQAIAIAP